MQSIPCMRKARYLHMPHPCLLVVLYAVVVRLLLVVPSRNHSLSFLKLLNGTKIISILFFATFFFIFRPARTLSHMMHGRVVKKCLLRTYAPRFNEKPHVYRYIVKKKKGPSMIRATRRKREVQKQRPPGAATDRSSRMTQGG